jgi:predicted N-formylglutamate amidohydrolase
VAKLTVFASGAKAMSVLEFAATPEAANEHPVTEIAGDPASGVIVLCDHASNEIPPEYRALGLPESELSRHIAYDIGAAWMAERLAERLSAPALLTNFSRLLIDPNRGDDDPTLVMRFSDGAIVPGNAKVDESEVERRIRRFFRPYDRAITAAINRSLDGGIRPVILSIHSFTPVWRGYPRPWHAGILWARDGRLSRALIAAMRAAGDLVVGDNEPYNGALTGDVIDRHALKNGFSNTLIEIRQDLIAERETASAWGDRLADFLEPLLADPVHREDFRRI